MTDADRGGALRLQRLEATYPGFELGPIDLEVSAGETLAVLGPNGSGKSTLLRVIAGLEPASRGRVLLGDRDLTELPPHRRGIGMVFQDLALFPQKTVRANLEYGPLVQGWSRGERARRTDELLEQFRLRELADRTPVRLSGGERQRVALARALAPRPEVLLLDEPLAAADPRSARTLQAELKGYLREAGIPALYVTHDFEEGLFLCPRIAFLDQGSWVEDGPSEEVFRAPRKPFTAWFLGYNLLDEAALAGRPETSGGRDAAVLPRDLRFVAVGTAGSWTGRVVEGGSSGPLVRAFVQLEDVHGRVCGEPVEVHAPAGDGTAPPRSGDRVAVIADRVVRLEEPAPTEGLKRGEGSRPSRNVDP